MNNNINVNMTPNPLDLQRLECSQFDTTPRQFQFTLHNQGETYDLSNISDPVFTSFPVEAGGTEELLPTNTSTPTTSPILADIQYPDGLREDESFTYRESPTTVDGKAKVKVLKGNTLVWNQLIPSSQSSSTVNGITFTNNNGTWTVNGTATANASIYLLIANPGNKTGHKMLLKGCPQGGSQSTYRLFDGSGNNGTDIGNGVIYTVTATNGNYSAGIIVNNGVTVNNLVFRPQLFDLTQMFGTGNEPTTVDEFVSLFSNSYYPYGSGSLLSFMGSGIKTTGKNILSYSGENLPYNANGVSITREDNIYKVVSSNPSGYPFARISTIHYLPKGTYTVLMLGAETSNRGIAWRLIDRNVSPVKLIVNSSATTTSFTLNEDLHDVYFEITIDASRLATGTWDVQFALEIGQQTDYEPYKESTTDLPVLTYFPTGMKSAGSVRDELSDNKATTRLIKTVVDGTSKTASYYGAYLGHQLFYIDLFGQALVDTRYSNALLSNVYKTSTVVEMDDMSMRYQNTNTGLNIGRIYWTDDRYTSASAMNTALQSSPLEIISLVQSETEQSIMSASLVTENAEIPLYVSDDMLVGDCTEELTSEAGYHVAKIRFTDSDGSNYSNKIQLHVERSPQ